MVQVRLPSLFRGRWRTVGYAAAAALTVAMVLGASFAWFRNEPYITEEEVRAAETAGPLLDEVEQPPVFTFLVDDDAVEAPTFLVARAWNVALASLPPDRIRTAVPVIDAGRTESRERAGLRRVLEDLVRRRTATAVGDGDPGNAAPHVVSVILPPFAPGMRDAEIEPEPWLDGIYVFMHPPPPERVTRIADESLPFGGSWTYRVVGNEKGCTLTIREDGEVYNPLFRFMSRFVFGHIAPRSVSTRSSEPSPTPRWSRMNKGTCLTCRPSTSCRGPRSLVSTRFRN